MTEPTQIIRGRRFAALNFWGWILIVASIAGTVLSFALLPHPRTGCVAAGAVLLALGLIACLHTDTVEIEPSRRRFRTRRGIRPFVRRTEQEIQDDCRIILRTRSGINFTGDPVSSGVVWFESGGRKCRLFSGDLGEVTSRAYELAGWLRIPAEHASALGPMRNPARVLTWSTWIAMMAVILVMLWPALSGSRPIRLIDWTQSQNDYKEPHAIAAYRDGLNAYNRNDFEQAERLIREALKDRPHDANMMNMLAYALAGQNRLDDALNTARNALAEAPKSGNIADTVAEMLQRRGEFHDAAVMYEEALRLQDTQDGGVEETHTKYGETLLALGRRGEALKELNRATQFGVSQWAGRARQVLAGKVTDFRKP